MLRQTFLAYLISQLEMYLASCGLDGQHQLEMPSHIEEPQNRNSEMLSLIRMLAPHAHAVIHVPLVPTIVANNGIMAIPSLPHGSTKTTLMRNYQSTRGCHSHRLYSSAPNSKSTVKAQNWVEVNGQLKPSKHQ